MYYMLCVCVCVYIYIYIYIYEGLSKLASTYGFTRRSSPREAFNNRSFLFPVHVYLVSAIYFAYRVCVLIVFSCLFGCSDPCEERGGVEEREL